MKFLIKPSILILSLMTTLTVQASILYEVNNTSKVNCTGASHGLWTNSDIGGGACSNYFSIDGVFTLHNEDADSNNWSATLNATATNPQNVNANIDLLFTNFANSWGSYKQEGGASYDPTTMDFFTSIAGTIDVDGTSYDIDSFVSKDNKDYVFQYGAGANAKDPNEFGASAWVRSCGDTTPNGECMASDHWDLNLTFTAVPEPSSLLLFSIGLLGFSSTFKRQTKSFRLSSTDQHK